jgi:hypothetical protein
LVSAAVDLEGGGRLNNRRDFFLIA